MDIRKLVRELKDNNIDLALAGADLEVNYDGDRLPPIFYQAISDNKPALVEFLKKMHPREAGTILPGQRTTLIPLSFAQERLWVIDQLEGSTQYHISSVLGLYGTLRKDALQHALEQLIDRHEVLRTIFEQRNDQVCQKIMDGKDWHMHIIDDDRFMEDPDGLEKYVADLTAHPFDLSRDYMFRAHLIRQNPAGHLLVIVIHHIASDGWSMPIMINELKELYAAGAEDRPARLAPLTVQYADYAVWQRGYLTDEVLAARAHHWQKKLADITPLQLPADYTRTAVPGNRGAMIKYTVNSRLTRDLVQLNGQEGVTLFMTLLSVLKVLLYRYSGQNDISVGSPIANRQQHGVEGLIGFFINTLVLRSQLTDSMSFRDLLQQVKETALDAYEHQELPYEKVADAVTRDRDTRMPPLFQVMMVLQDKTVANVLGTQLGDVEFVLKGSPNPTAKFDLTFAIEEDQDGLSVGIEYRTGLYRKDTIDRMFGHFQQLLRSAVADPAAKIANLEMLTGPEKIQLLDTFNATGKNYPQQETIVSLFTQQAAATPDGVALVYEGQTLTYRELDEQSNRLGHFLLRSGIGIETLVPVCIERGIRMVVTILGILKAGAAYLPLDPEYPPQRIDFMLKDTAADFIVYSRACEEVALRTPCSIKIDLDRDGEKIAQESAAGVGAPLLPEHPAYVIYTSGSTGIPKGVMIEHKGVVNLYYGQLELLGLRRGYCMAQFSSLSFDASVQEIFCTLLQGGKLIVISRETKMNTSQLGNILRQEGVEVIANLPSYLSLAREELGSLTALITAGEMLPLRIAREFREKGFRLVNIYGPTENTVCTTLSNSPIHENECITIGKPMANMQIVIWDSGGHLCPIGIPGEICIGGLGLAKGYLNAPGLTAEKFIRNPYAADRHSRLYRTGDLGRWLPDGNIEYIGRIDRQIKIRGYRIETEEIEQVLQRIGSIKGSAVIPASDDRGNKKLIGYLVVEGPFDRTSVMTALRKELPAYMVPSVWITMDSMPLTVNGKIDKNRLPPPDFADLSAGKYVAPRNEIEWNLVKIWAGVLGIDISDIGVEHNFFEIGGDSIITIQIANRARRIGYVIQPAEIFVHQTIGMLATLIATRKRTAITGEQGILTGACGLLPVQQWFLADDQPQTSHYNQSVLLGIRKEISIPALARAIERLTAFHDSLRFAYTHNPEGWSQTYQDKTTGLIVEDYSDSPVTMLRNTLETRSNHFQSSLDIAAGDLVRTVLFLTPKEEKYNHLLIIVHHLAIDGVSWRILLEDLDQCLENTEEQMTAPLGEKGSSFRQWHSALEEYGRSASLLAQQTYWINIARRYTPLRSRMGPRSPLKNTGICQNALDTELTRQLIQEVPLIYHTEINDILLHALARTLCRFFGKDELIVGLEGHGRENMTATLDISRTVGWFTTIYPILLKPGSEWFTGPLKGLLNKVPDKGLGYGTLKYMNQVKELEGPHPWDILFNYLGRLDNIITDSKWLAPAGGSSGENISSEYAPQEMIIINSRIQKDQLHVGWTYDKDIFTPDEIRELADSFLADLASIVHACRQQKDRGPVFVPSDPALAREIGYGQLNDFLLAEQPPARPGTTARRRCDEITSVYSLSGLQTGILFHSLYEENNGAYIEQLSCDLEGLVVDAFRSAWDHLLQRHSILRSSFHVDSFHIPVQCVHRQAQLPITLLDYRHLTEEEKNLAVDAYIQKDRITAFAWNEAPLIRLVLIRCSEHQHRMLLTHHHIILDGWSMPLLMAELLTNYECIVTGRPIGEKKEDKYEEYILYLERNDKNREERYWRTYLQGLETRSFLPFITQQAERNKGKGEYRSSHMQLDRQTLSRLTTYAGNHRLTINTIMQGVWSLLLSAYTGNEDIVYGIVVSGRPDDLPEIESRVGMYINTLPLRNRPDKDRTIDEWLRSIQDDQLQSRMHQYASLEEIRKGSGLRGDLFDSLLIFENYPVSKMISSRKWALQVKNLQIREQGNYPLIITVRTGEEAVISFSYNATLLQETEIKRIRGHFEQVLQQLISGEKERLADIGLVTPEEQKELLSLGGLRCPPAVAHPPFSLRRQLQYQLSTHRDAPSVRYRDRTLTYEQLQRITHQLSHTLYEDRQMRRGDRVGVLLNRSEGLIISLLSIWNNSLVYVPIDAGYPPERIRVIMDDARLSLVITETFFKDLITEAGYEYLNLPEFMEQMAAMTIPPIQKPQEISLLQQDEAYIIYTSGSTGVPKGVSITHGSLDRFFEHVSKECLDGTPLVMPLIASTSFDISLFQAITPLLSGGVSLIVDQQQLQDTGELVSILQDATAIDTVPGLYNMVAGYIEDHHLNNSFGHIKKIFIGGDYIGDTILYKLSGIFNNAAFNVIYGPTEGTVFCTHLTYQPRTIGRNTRGAVLGKPIKGSGIYILADNGSLQPQGVQGEICIAGAGVGRGYLNQPQQTKEKFVDDPYLPGAMIYRTGDLGCWLADGYLEFRGRNDRQVKINGYRIELGEIERALQTSGWVSQSLALMHKKPSGNAYLTGYIVPNGAFNKKEILASLQRTLPGHMIPSLLIEIDKMPLTANGKIDTRALPDPDQHTSDHKAYIGPGNKKEQLLSSVWKELLALDRIDIHDNFFELGGDSIISMQVVSRMKRHGYPVRPKDLFMYPTIAALAARLTASSQRSDPGEQGLLTGACGLLPVQQQYLEYTENNTPWFHQHLTLGVVKGQPTERWAAAIGDLLIHHDSLRFRYHYQDKKWTQSYSDHPGGLTEEDAAAVPSQDLPEYLGQRLHKYQQDLDIEKGIMLRAVLIRTGEEISHDRLLLIIHHLATDAVSWRIILEDLETLVQSKIKEEKTALGSKGSSYRQCFHALEEYARTEAVTGQRAYWTGIVNAYRPFPGAIQPRRKGWTKSGRTLTGRLNPALTRSLLQEAPQAYHTEINDLLLAALSLTLAKWTGCPMVVIGLEGHGRENIPASVDPGRTTGWFTTLFPVLLETWAQKTIGDQIRTVKEQLRTIPDKGLGYGLLKYINKAKGLEHDQPWDIVFNYLGQFDNILSGSEIFKAVQGPSEQDEDGTAMTRDELAVNTLVKDGRLTVNWTYSSGQYGEEQIQYLLDEYLSNLEETILHCVEQAGRGAILTPSDYGLTGQVRYEELDRFLDEKIGNGKRSEKIDRLYRLSILQEGMLFHGLYDRHAGAYITQMDFHFDDIDIEKLKKSWNYLIKRHTILRTGFEYDAFGVPVQCVYKDVEMPVDILDYRDMDASAQLNAMADYSAADRIKGFDFRSAPLMRIALFRLDGGRYSMLWTHHHILMDGWSKSLLTEEFLTAYEDLHTAGECPPVREKDSDKYEDYIRYIQQRDKGREQLYWKQYLAGIGDGTYLPFVRATPERNRGIGTYNEEILHLDRDLSRQIEEFARKNSITVNTLMQAAWAYLVHRYTGKTRVTFGSIVSGRPDEIADVEHKVGMYINTQPVHISLQAQENIADWVTAIQKGQLESREFEYTTLTDIQRWIGVQKDLFDNLLVFENYPVSKVITGRQWQLQIKGVRVKEQTNYPLSIIIRSGPEILLGFCYNAGLIDPFFVRQMAGHFRHVLTTITSGQAKKLGDIELLSPAELQSIVYDFNETEKTYARDKRLETLLEEQAKRNPDHVAVRQGGRTMSYGELNGRSNRLARHLLGLGVEPGEALGLQTGRDFEMIVGMYGILKAGGSYVPVDPEYPAERRQYMLRQSGVRRVLVDDREGAVGLADCETIVIGEGVMNSDDPNDLGLELDSDQLAYTIYTSGSTGRPKGVMIAHHSVVNLLEWVNREFGIGETDRLLFITPMCFDLSVYDIFGILSCGGTVVMATREEVQDLSRLQSILREERITFWDSVPTTMSYLVEELAGNEAEYQQKDLRWVFLSGDWIPVGLPEKVCRYFPGAKVIGLGGATEGTVWSNYYRVEKVEAGWNSIPYGRPLQNNRFYILDEHQQVVPRGVSGELYIGGVGVARGYANDKERTEQSFMADPFWKGGGGKMYRTGDLGRLLPDGNMEFLGRRDAQVKIRGYRIELGEIESVIGQSGQVKQSAVLVKEDGHGSRRLVGYIVPSGDWDRSELQSCLQSRLPEYMIPGVWIELEALPLTSNGKVDRRALEQLSLTEGEEERVYTAPQTETQHQLAAIWKDLLQVERVGIHDNFFDLGGHSLMVTRAVSRIKRQFNMEVPVRSMFYLTTLEALAGYIESTTLRRSVLTQQYKEINI